MENKTNFSRRLKQFDGLTWLTLIPVFYARSAPLYVYCIKRVCLKYICGLNSKERIKNAEVRALLRLEPSVSLIIEEDRLRWFAHIERKDDADLVKCSMMIWWWRLMEQDREVFGKKTWWDLCRRHGEFGPVLRGCTDLHSLRIYGEGKNQGGNRLSHVHLTEWPLKRCVRVCAI